MTANNQYLINGDKNIALSPLDRGFTYGDGVFRTMKVVNGAVMHWEIHHQKLVEDCNALGIVCPSSELLLSDACKLIEKNESAVIKIVITRGESLRGYALPPLAKPNRVVIKSSSPDYPKSNFTNGVALFLCSIRLSEQPQLAGVKHLNRLENVLARSEWSDNSYADGLMLDAYGNVIECTMSNLFARFNNKLLTPDLSRCGVAGITRQRIIDLAKTLKMQIEVTDIPLKTLMKADEVIICNSLFGVWQVTSLNDSVWARGKLAETIHHQLLS